MAEASTFSGELSQAFRAVLSTIDKHARKADGVLNEEVMRPTQIALQ